MLSIVLACIMLMSIFSALPMQVGAASSSIPIYTCKINLGRSCDYKSRAVVPSVTVKYGSKTLMKNVDYTIKCTNNTYPNTPKYQPKVTITGKGAYYGSMTLNFKINKPKTPSGFTASNKVMDKIRLSWNTVYCSTYEVEMNSGSGWEDVRSVYGTTLTYDVYTRNLHEFRLRSVVKNRKTGELSYSNWAVISINPRVW